MGTRQRGDDRPKWSKYYWAQHLKDPLLRLCKAASRGVWQDLQAVMFTLSDRDRIGYLCIGGRSPSMVELARLSGNEVRVVRAALVDLEVRGVFSRDEKGLIYSRRMVRDMLDYERDRANGMLGGSPLLVDSVAAEQAQKYASDSKENPNGIPLESVLPQNCKQVSNENNDLGEIRVNPPLKAKNYRTKELKKEKDWNPADSSSGADDARAGEGDGFDRSGTGDGFENVVPLRQGELPVQPSSASKPKADRPGSGGRLETLPLGPVPLGPRPSLTESERLALVAMEDEAVAMWNRMCAAGGCAAVTALPLGWDRRRKLRARLRECGGLDGWATAMAKAAGSPLWQGQTHRHWRPGFDDVISPRKFRRLMEGLYDADPAYRIGAPQPTQPHALDDIVAKYAKRYGIPDPAAAAPTPPVMGRFERVRGGMRYGSNAARSAALAMLDDMP